VSANSQRPRIVIVANTVWYLANFRLRLCRTLIEQGFDVLAVAPAGDDALRLMEADITFVPLAMDGGGTNPIKDFLLWWRLVRLLRTHAPVVCLSYTAKPNIYVGLACRWVGVPRIHNIAGLGTAFIEESWLTVVVKHLYQWALKGAECVFFQNPDDLALFQNAGLVTRKQSDLLPGSGVDVDAFTPAEASAECSGDAAFRFLLSARLITQKGIKEYVGAARQLLAAGHSVECWLLGHLGVDNPSAISEAEVRGWEAEGVIAYLGSVEDVRPVLAQVDCVVLPSYYREGVPRVLLEAAAMGLPVITTDAVGCREAVDAGKTGLLCRPRDVEDLARCMYQMLSLPRSERIAMGQRGRAKMQREFDERIVIDRYHQTISTILLSTGARH